MDRSLSRVECLYEIPVGGGSNQKEPCLLGRHWNAGRSGCWLVWYSTSLFFPVKMPGLRKVIAFMLFKFNALSFMICLNQYREQGPTEQHP